MRTKQQLNDIRYMAALAGHEEARLQWRRFRSRQNEIVTMKNTLPIPLVSPPAKRRRMALLFLIDEFYQEFGFYVGRRGRPPYTPDMRWLVGHEYLRMERVRSNYGWENSTRLVPTELGRRNLKSTKVSEADRAWGYQVLAHGMFQ